MTTKNRLKPLTGIFFQMILSSVRLVGSNVDFVFNLLG
jgi:hypothetical protein